MTNLTRLREKNINGVAFSIAPLIRELRAFGEDETADWLDQVDESAHDKVSRLAMKILLKDRMTIDKAICLAAVEVFEGNSRPLRRKRRSYRGLD